MNSNLLIDRNPNAATATGNVNSFVVEQATERLYYFKHGFIGIFGAASPWLAKVVAAKEVFLMISALLGCIVASISIYKLLRGPSPKTQKSPDATGITPLIAVGLAALFFSGCTFHEKRRVATSEELQQNQAQMTEESRALTTGAKDALDHAPTNAPVNLAKTLLAKDQQIEGLPKKRIPVEDILNGHAEAIAEMRERFKLQEALIEKNSQLEAKLRQREEELLAMGKKYEEERNKSVVKRFWLWATGTFGLLGGIAFIVFCPAIALPLLSRLIGWVVSAVPAAAKVFGVVTKGAWDATVRGLDKAKEKMSVRDKEVLLETLGREMDSSHKKLVRVARPAPVAA